MVWAIEERSDAEATWRQSTKIVGDLHASYAWPRVIFSDGRAVTSGGRGLGTGRALVDYAMTRGAGERAEGRLQNAHEWGVIKGTRNGTGVGHRCTT